MPPRRPQIIAHHLIWTLYGHWLPNDLRGSGSSELREEKFAPLGDIHRGRKPAKQQPSRDDLREFHRNASPLLQHTKFWLDEPKRQLIASAFGEVIAERNYTIWAYAILSNHAHMIVRRHRDDALTMWEQLANGAGQRLRKDASVADNHPVWSERPYKVFLHTPEAVCSCIRYIAENPGKEGLLFQWYPFVQSYNNWPFHKS